MSCSRSISRKQQPPPSKAMATPQNDSKSSAQSVNINEKKYISLLNEFEKSSLPLLELKSNEIDSAHQQFVNAVRAFGMDSTVAKLNQTNRAFEMLEANYSRIIDYTHRRYEPNDRKRVHKTTPAIFSSMQNGIRILREFHEHCGKYNLLDREEVNVFMELTKNSKCLVMAVYVENDFFKSMNELCRNFGNNNYNEEVCSTTVQYRSAKERLDNINDRSIEHSYNDVKNFIAKWEDFLNVVVVFIIKNYLRLRDRRSTMCFKTFLDQQYQIVYDYYNQLNAYNKKIQAQQHKDKIGLIWN